MATKKRPEAKRNNLPVTAKKTALGFLTLHDKDAVLLCEMVRLNRDAAAFYRMAAGKIVEDMAVQVFLNLETLHETVANGLSSRLREILNDISIPDVMEEADCDSREYFGPLIQDLAHGLSLNFIEHMEEAESQSLHRMAEAGNEPLTSKTQNLLINMCDELELARGYLAELRNNVR